MCFAKATSLTQLSAMADREEISEGSIESRHMDREVGFEREKWQV